MFKKIMRFIWDKYCQSSNPTAFVRSLGVRLGENTHFYGLTRQMFGSEPWFISIGNNCFITSGVQFVTHDGGTLILRQEQPDLEWTSPIEIGNDVYIGIRTIILPGVKIGNRCIIGAGSIVSKNIPDNSVAAGVPAKIIRSVDDYFLDMNKKSLRCGHLSPEKKAIKIREIYRKKGWHDPIYKGGDAVNVNVSKEK